MLNIPGTQDSRPARFEVTREAGVLTCRDCGGELGRWPVPPASTPPPTYRQAMEQLVGEMRELMQGHALRCGRPAR